jgi:hypothetical protein
VVDLASGQVVALVRFDTTVQEIFGVTVLPGRRWGKLITDAETLFELVRGARRGAGRRAGGAAGAGHYHPYRGRRLATGPGVGRESGRISF